MSGRAGRDGLPSRCLLFYSSKDVQTLTFLANNRDPGNAAGGGGNNEAATVGAAKIQEMQVRVCACMRACVGWFLVERGRYELCAANGSPDRPMTITPTATQRFARAAGCRRKALLAHFGEELVRDKPPEPGACCDFCDLNIDGTGRVIVLLVFLTKTHA